MRIGIFGGSFDPVHYGHLILAEQCREQAKLEQVWFVPCSIQPLKERDSQTTDRQRIEMLEMATAGHDSFRVSRLEIERGGTSYTVETLEQIRITNPDDELFLLMGSDSLDSFAKWKLPERILELASPLVVNRPGSGPVDLSVLSPFAAEERIKQARLSVIESPLIDISSTQLRQRVRDSRSIRYLVPRAVEKYIETQKIYR